MLVVGEAGKGITVERVHVRTLRGVFLYLDENSRSGLSENSRSGLSESRKGSGAAGWQMLGRIWKFHPNPVIREFPEKHIVKFQKFHL